MPLKYQIKLESIFLSVTPKISTSSSELNVLNMNILERNFYYFLWFPAAGRRLTDVART